MGEQGSQKFRTNLPLISIPIQTSFILLRKKIKIASKKTFRFLLTTVRINTVNELVPQTFSQLITI